MTKKSWVLTPITSIEKKTLSTNQNRDKQTLGLNGRTKTDKQTISRKRDRQPDK